MKWKNTFWVGLYKCEMTYSESRGLHAKWSPKLPGHREFSSQEVAQYRSGRDNLIAEVAKSMGASIAVIETSPNDDVAGLADAVRAGMGIPVAILESE